MLSDLLLEGSTRLPWELLPLWVFNPGNTPGEKAAGDQGPQFIVETQVLNCVCLAFPVHRKAKNEIE